MGPLRFTSLRLLELSWAPTPPHPTRRPLSTSLWSSSGVELHAASPAATFSGLAAMLRGPCRRGPILLPLPPLLLLYVAAAATGRRRSAHAGAAPATLLRWQLLRRLLLLLPLAWALRRRPLPLLLRRCGIEAMKQVVVVVVVAILQLGAGCRRQPAGDAGRRLHLRAAVPLCTLSAGR